MSGPLEQFQVKMIGPSFHVLGYDVSFTNSALWMVIATVFIIVFVILGMRKKEIIPAPWQSIVECSFEFVDDMVISNVGEAGRPFFPFIFCLFMFILFGNIFGLIPYSFTYTSQIIVTAVLALIVFFGVTLVGFYKHGFKFLSFLLPKEVPWLLIPLMIPIELISYLSRPVSLSIRLFANMMAGHTMIKVFAGFVFSLSVVTFGIGGIVPISVNVLLYAFETMIAFLQAYVFAILACIYLNDALHLH